jgi:hypothetical protein
MVLVDGIPEIVLTAENIHRTYAVESHAYADPITGHLRIAVL